MVRGARTLFVLKGLHQECQLVGILLQFRCALQKPMARLHNFFAPEPQLSENGQPPPTQVPRCTHESLTNERELALCKVFAAINVITSAGILY